MKAGDLQLRDKEHAVGAAQEAGFAISSPRFMARLAARVLAVALLAATATAACAAQSTYASPQEAVDALARAMKANDQASLHDLFGPGADELISSGDTVADAHNRSVFNAAYAESNRLDVEGAAQATLVVGKDEWPMPIPLVKNGARWHFDTQQGATEILARRIGRNELSAMKTCLAIMDAEREYATRDLDADGVPEYAARFVSAPGKRDGLYWPTSENEPPSPLGALLAAAADEGYARPGSRTLAPYNGYYYRILTRQGSHASGGARDYEVKGRLMGGLALLAYPARYGASGFATFIVSEDGALYEKNLGSRTQAIVAGITAFDPDASWKKSDLAE
jgi:DUF2950 family protein